MPAPLKRSFSAGQFQFSLDGAPTSAYVKSVDGGFMKGEVVSEQIGNDFTAYKHVSTLQIEPLTVEMGMAISQPVIDWISDSWQRRFSRRNGSILHADFRNQVHYEQWFYDALITETTIPTLDASSRDAAYMTVKIQPERLEVKKGSGELKGNIGSKQMLWTPSQFVVDIDGCECRGINKVESFTVKQNVNKLYIGAARYPEIEPTKLEIPDITLEMSMASADDFFKWYESYVVKGKRDDKAEREGEIQFYDQNGGIPLMTLQLKSMGLYSLQVLKSEAAGESIKRVKAQLYVENCDIISGFGLE